MEKIIILIVVFGAAYLVTGAVRRRHPGVRDAAERRSEQRTMRAWERLHNETKRNTRQR